MEIAGELKTANASLSEANQKFLEFVERNPECLRRSEFSVLDEPHPLVPFPLQSWPIFLSPKTVQEMERAVVGIAQLIRSLPERLFGNDAERIAEFTGFGIAQAQFLARVLQDRSLIGGLMSRGDYVFTADGLKCLEVNMASILGGLASSAQAPLFLDIPVVARFLREAGVKATCKDNVHALFSFVFGESRSLASDGELNIALVLATMEGISPQWQEHFDGRWSRLLRKQEPALKGHVRFCAITDLEESKEHLYLNGKRIHAVVEYYGEPTPDHILIPWLAHNLRLYNPPIRAVLHDKRNLALLSEFADSGLFSFEERALIHQHVPWTRRVGPGSTTYRGRRMRFAALLPAERERLVMKPNRGFSGQGVCIGRVTPEAEWIEVVESAIEEGGWVVQEYVESLPFLYQSDGACVPHDVIWGVFAFDHIAGSGYLRMAPQAQGRIVNSAQGATEGLFFEVEA